MSKFYISFGQIHIHSINGKTFDKDCLARIEAESYEEAHKKAMEIFNGVFHNCHEENELSQVIEYYNRGVIAI